jgi:2-polyprenyl-3-methyl-5-hydroxy-6-metoxy-1,4-benzoquinol methylase
MNYRKRLYENYVSTNWAYTHSLKEEEYELYAKASKKRYGGILPQDKSAHIIDIVCGGGHFLYFLQQQGYSNTRGIDISQEQLDVAEKMGVKKIQIADFSNIY